MKKPTTITRSEKRYAGQDHDVRVAERRDRIIKAGLRLFGTVGYHATTVRLLCAESELTARYYYESFDSLEALLIACYQQLMSEFQENLTNSMKSSGPDLGDIVKSGLRCFFEAVRDPIFAKITMVEVVGVSPLVDVTHLKNADSFGRLMMNAMATEETINHFSQDELDVLGFSLAGALTFAAIHWMKGGYRIPIDQMIENGFTILIGTAERLNLTA